MDRVIKFNGYYIVKEDYGYSVYTQSGDHLRYCENIFDAKDFCGALLTPDED